MRKYVEIRDATKPTRSVIYVSQFNSLEVNAFEEWNHWLNLIYNPLRLFQVSSIGCRKIVHALKIVFKPPGMAIRIFCQKTGSADPQFSVRILWILVKNLQNKF